MSCTLIDRAYVGETIEQTLTIFDEATGARTDLTSVVSIVFKVRITEGGADPALITLGIGSGITLEPQSGDTLGQATIRFTAPAAGTYWYHAEVTMPGPKLFIAVPPTKFIVRHA